MKSEFFTAIKISLLTLLLTGILYPIATTVIAGTVFSQRAGGSLIEDESGRVVGSELIGQSFKSPAYLQPRPSAAGEGYDAGGSSGSNLGPTSRKLRERAEAEARRQIQLNPKAPLPVPADLVTASASGLDPHLSLEGAIWQARRIGGERGVSEDRVVEAIREVSEERDLLILGEPRVNVLLANLALDRLFGKPGQRPPE